MKYTYPKLSELVSKDMHLNPSPLNVTVMCINSGKCMSRLSVTNCLHVIAPQPPLTLLIEINIASARAECSRLVSKCSVLYHLCWLHSRLILYSMYNQRSPHLAPLQCAFCKSWVLNVQPIPLCACTCTFHFHYQIIAYRVMYLLTL